MTTATFSFDLLPQPPGKPAPSPRVPRLARLLALALKFDGLIRTGTFRDFADVARLGHVSRARVSQIMNLLLLAPDIQEEILFLPPTDHGRDPIILAHVQPFTLVPSWKTQRRLWRRLRQRQVSSRQRS